MMKVEQEVYLALSEYGKMVILKKIINMPITETKWNDDEETISVQASADVRYIDDYISGLTKTGWKVIFPTAEPAF